MIARNTSFEMSSLFENNAASITDHSTTKLKKRRTKVCPLDRGGALLDLLSGMRREINGSLRGVEPIGRDGGCWSSGFEIVRWFPLCCLRRLLPGVCRHVLPITSHIWLDKEC